MKMVYNQPPVIENDGLTIEEKNNACHAKTRLAIVGILFSIIFASVMSEVIGAFFAALLGFGLIATVLIKLARMSDEKYKDYKYKPSIKNGYKYLLTDNSPYGRYRRGLD